MPGGSPRQDGSTEYMSGQTLDEKLATGGLSEKEVVSLGRQLAQGLSAAHEQDIVHRDLKPANLRLTSDGRLKILDFGLAQLMPHASEVGMTATLTQSQEVTGTLPYMAPEQLRGEPAEARTDVWAAGAVLYEMATAHRPFEQKVPSALTDDIIHNPPLPPRRLRSELSPKLEAVILKCLEKEPAKRYQSARELQTDLERLSTGVTPIAAQLQWRWPVIAAIVIVVLFSVAASWYLLRRRIDRSTASAIHARHSVAVLGFKNLSGKPEVAWLSTAFSEMLTTELAAGGRLRTVPGESISQMKINLALPDADSYGKETLSKIRQNLGTDEVVLGSYLALGNGQVRLDLKLEDASTGEIVDSITASGNDAEVADLVSRAGASLRGKLGAGEVSAADAMTMKASLPSNPEAARFYSEGLTKLRSFDNLTARDLLQKAIAVEPNFSLAHSALATAWSGLGYDAKAKEEGKKAFDLSGNLGPEERLWVEGQYRETAKEWDKAVEVYRALFHSFPDNVDYGLRLANAQNSADKPRDALSTVEVLRRLPLEARDDPRISLMETQAVISLGEFQRAQVTATKVVEKGEAQGARLVVAGAYLWDCWASMNLDQLDRATASCDAARRIYASANDTRDTLRVLTSMATVLLFRGDYAASQKIYEEVLVGARKIGNQNYAAVSLGNIGIVLDYQGDLVGAKKHLQEALTIFRKADTKSSVAYFSMGFADVLYNLGDPRGAKAKLEESVEMNREIGDKRTMGYALSELGLVFSALGNLAEAQRKSEEALSIWTEFGNKEFVENTQLDLADLLTEEGNPGEAQSLARAALGGLAREKGPADDQVWAYIVLARALLARGKAEDAQSEVARAAETAAASQNRGLLLQLAITAARVHATLGQPSEAKRSLDATIAEARKYGFVPHQLDARLALGEIEMKSGQTASGRVHLQALEREAHAKGFELIARKSAAAAKG
jgi:eukaryotic-like serine/threonine-protein kinase